MSKFKSKYFHKENKDTKTNISQDHLDVGFVNGAKKKKSKLNIPLIRKIMKTPGIPPGTLKYSGEKNVNPVHIDVIDFTDKDFNQKRVKNIKECLKLKTKSSTTWVNVTGIHDVSIVEDIGKIFEIHPLVLEDILHAAQRPKVEFHTDYIYVVMKMVFIEEDKKEVQSQQISFIITSNYVITFQEREKDIFDTIRERIKNHKGIIRENGNDYMAYALIDAIIDNYFPVLEKFGDVTDKIENEIFDNPSPNTLNEINFFKRELIILRRSIWPIREVVNSIHRDETGLITDRTKTYLRDAHDHTLQIVDNIEALRDVTSTMIEMYLSTVNQKMNEIMKTLTIISTIFIPLTFIVGVYGMNFTNMPELRTQNGYFILWGIMILIFISMIGFFKKRKWI